jgi:hypothetical protein
VLISSTKTAQIDLRVRAVNPEDDCRQKLRNCFPLLNTEAISANIFSSQDLAGCMIFTFAYRYSNGYSKLPAVQP